MKKIIVLMAAAFISFGVSYAQTEKEIRNSDQRISQITSLITPSECSLESVNNVASQACAIAKRSVEISTKLNEMKSKIEAMKAQKSTSSSALEKAALLKTCKELANKTISQSSGITSSLVSLGILTGEISAIKSAAQQSSAKKSVENTKELLDLLNNETSYQVKSVGNMISIIRAL